MMTFGFTDQVTELRARSMMLASEVAVRCYGFKFAKKKMDQDSRSPVMDDFMASFFEPVLEYMSAPGMKIGDTLLAREAALRSAITLYSAPGVFPQEMSELFALAKEVSHMVMPELAGVEESEDKRLVNRFLPHSLQK